MDTETGYTASKAEVTHTHEQIKVPTGRLKRDEGIISISDRTNQHRKAQSPSCQTVVHHVGLWTQGRCYNKLPPVAFCLTSGSILKDFIQTIPPFDFSGSSARKETAGWWIWQIIYLTNNSIIWHIRYSMNSIESVLCKGLRHLIQWGFCYCFQWVANSNPWFFPNMILVPHFCMMGVLFITCLFKLCHLFVIGPHIVSRGQPITSSPFPLLTSKSC